MFEGETARRAIKRPLEDWSTGCAASSTFPHGAFLLTGTGIVPPEDFSLRPGDVVSITIGDLTLQNEVAK